MAMGSDKIAEPEAVGWAPQVLRDLQVLQLLGAEAESAPSAPSAVIQVLQVLQPEPEAVGWALQVLRAFFAPDALDALYQDVVKFSRFKRTADEYLVKFDPSRRKAEARMHTGCSFPAAVASASRPEYASLRQVGESPVLASVHGGLGIVKVTQKMRQLPGPMGGCGRQDVRYVADGEDGNLAFLGG